MLKKRIIPCLDIQNGRTVKGINFKHIRDAGDPVELAQRYVDEGADELVFLDISATNEKRKTLVQLVEKIGSAINIPFTVGGGIRSVEDASLLLKAGADKISVNSAAVKDPKLISRLSDKLGSQAIVVAIDSKKQNQTWRVYVHGGQKETGLRTQDWAQKVEKLGAGEILLTSMNHDGTKSGFALSLTNDISRLINIPIIASGGAGGNEDFYDLFRDSRISAGLAASIFHYGEITISELKSFINLKGIPVRCK